MSEKLNFESFIAKLAILLKTTPEKLLTAELSAVPSYDSLGRIEVAMLIEDDFGWLISQDQLATCSNAQEVFDVVAQHAN